MKKEKVMVRDSLSPCALILRDTHLRRESVLERIVDLARSDDALSGYTADQLVAALRAREQVSSTGVGGGIAIPHCHLPGLSRFVVGVVAIPSGVDFDACDGAPVHLLVFIFAPAERRNEHVSLLASASRVLANQEAVQSLLACKTDADLLACLQKRWVLPSPAAANGEMAVLTVFVQREDLLTPMLEMLSENGAGGISVIEGRSARTYLHRLPLFSGFWTDDDRGFLRIITTLVSSATCNDMVRRLMLIAGDTRCPGVLVTVQDVRLTIGRLEF